MARPTGDIAAQGRREGAAEGGEGGREPVPDAGGGEVG